MSDTTYVVSTKRRVPRSAFESGTAKTKLVEAEEPKTFSIEENAMNYAQRMLDLGLWVSIERRQTIFEGA